MSCVVTATHPSSPSFSNGGVRKRTSSFSAPKPLKAAKTLSGRPLKRTASYAVVPEYCGDDSLNQDDMSTSLASSSSSPPRHASDSSSLVPYTQTLRYYKEQQKRRKSFYLHHEPTIILNVCSNSPPPPSAPSSPPSKTTSFISACRLRTTSPLAPHPPTILPPSNMSSRSRSRCKREPDLFRAAITARMRCSPEGQKILTMGAHLAVSMLTATRELERIVAAQERREREREMENDGDSRMSGTGEVVLSSSWVVVPEGDWEMVDCGA
ncbi:hypothetical protein JAAARDRAFT_57054 [Jaapia argillacea MUCL 33604]|uniref:Uncharacterized protein n=1 Tax=Jaapia argillacea MUCL 33604 TaxID=933084 RepID=A0A067Q900_9AGAM|nr:hypothetical protein JAAARDRAFT_57054 [Jaapia argillacea MUCL 33604]